MVDSNNQKIIKEVNEIRELITSKKEYKSPGFFEVLIQKIRDTKYLSKQPIAKCLIADISSPESKIHLTRTKKYINDAKDNNIFSLFDASYFPSLTLEYISYTKLPVNEHLSKEYPSPTAPINIEHMTAGFESPIAVALFPENHIDHHTDEDGIIFYFINKFVDRHLGITQKMIKEIVSDDTLLLVRAASKDDIERASTYWVWLHEYHHRQGDMPISEYLEIKSLKPLAGLEELRVDISAMLVCLNDKNLPKEDAALAYEFILSERLLRYSVQGKRPNYDAVSSQLLFNYLIKHNGILTVDGIIHLESSLPAVLTRFLGEIQRIESFIHSEAPVTVQKRLLDFTNQYTIFDKTTMDYKHIPYFEKVKKELLV